MIHNATLIQVARKVQNQCSHSHRADQQQIAIQSISRRMKQAANCLKLCITSFSVALSWNTHGTYMQVPNRCFNRLQLLRCFVDGFSVCMEMGGILPANLLVRFCAIGLSLLFSSLVFFFFLLEHFTCAGSHKFGIPYSFINTYF